MKPRMTTMCSGAGKVGTGPGKATVLPMAKRAGSMAPKYPGKAGAAAQTRTNPA